MASKNTPRCPICDEPLAMPGHYCERCRKTFLECPNCHHLHPDWLTECTYCHASVLPDRALEIEENVVPDAKPLDSSTSSVSSPRAAKLEADQERREPYPDINGEDFERKATKQLSDADARMKSAIEDFNEEAVQQEEQRWKIAKEESYRKTERLNPRRTLLIAGGVITALWILTGLLLLFVILLLVLHHANVITLSMGQRAYLYVGVLLVMIFAIFWSEPKW